MANRERNRRQRESADDLPDGTDAAVQGSPLNIEEAYELPEISVELEEDSLRVTRLALTPELVAVAIYEARGLPSVAARKLGTTVRMITRYVREYEICAIAKSEADNMLLDFAEAKLMQKIRAGDIASIIFYLRTKGKERGYTEKEADKSILDRQAQEEAKREAQEREAEIRGKLDSLSDRLRDIGDLDLSSGDYVNGVVDVGVNGGGANGDGSNLQPDSA